MLISEYVKTDWLLYSSQNVLRSLPSFKDGQVLTTRKLLFALRNQQEYEVVERLGLKAASMTAYKNGGSSISNSLAGMGKSYAGSNNVPLFDGDGQFGTAIDNDTSETRYISVKISDNFRDWFSKDDDDILPLRVERGDELEYQWMAPIAPIALVNGAFGIATGYASNIQCHHPLDVIEGVIDVLNNGAPSKRLLPSWVDWKGTVERIDDSGTKFTATGKFERVNATSVRITELPPQYNNESYRKILLPLLENDAVVSFSNDSNKFNGWDITINFKRGILNKMSDEQIIDLLKLRKSFSHVLYGWGFDDHIAQYENVEDILIDWTYWRLGVYQQRIQYMIKKLEGQIAWELLKCEAIKMFLDNGGKAVRDEEIYNLVEIRGFGDEEFKKILDTPIRNMTVRGIEKQEKLVSALNQRLDYYRVTTADELMIGELNTLLETTKLKYPR